MSNHSTSRLRIRIEAALTAASAVFLVLTLVARDWIERTVGASPDGGSGETEWALTLVALAVTVGLAAVTTWDWRRTPATERA